MSLFRGWFVQRDGSNNGTSPKGGRLALAGLLSKTTGGVVGTGVLVDGLTPVVSGSGAGMSYNVRACAIVAKHSDANGPTISALDATENIALADDGSSLAAPGSNSRRDVIYAVQDLVTADGGTGTANTFRVAVRKGTAAASPATPSIADVSGAVALAYATVPSGTANTSGLVFTQLAPWAVANGGVIPDAKGAISGKVWDGDTLATVGLGETDWLTPTPGPAANLNPAWGQPGTRYKRSGLWVTLKIELQTTSGGAAGWTICTLPAGYRPSTRQHVALMNGSGTFYAWGQVQPSGVVSAQGSVVTGGQIIGQVTFPVDS